MVSSNMCEWTDGWMAVASNGTSTVPALFRFLSSTPSATTTIYHLASMVVYVISLLELNFQRLVFFPRGRDIDIRIEIKQ